MSVSVRIPQYLADRARELAEQERRSFANMVEVLIEEGLAARGADPSEAAHEARVASGADTRFDERGERAKTDAEWLKNRAGRKAGKSKAPDPALESVVTRDRGSHHPDPHFKPDFKKGAGA